MNKKGFRKPAEFEEKRINDILKKCPNCGGKLRKIGKMCKCKDCGKVVPQLEIHW